jgi:zinc protease
MFTNTTSRFQPASRMAALALIATMGLAAQVTSLPAGVQKVTNVEGITEYRLMNGLRVLLFPDPTKSNITVNVTYMVGSRHEQYGETGMAHLLEHLMFMGSKNHPDIKKELQDHGTRPNGSTWYDRTNYFETFAATDENLNWALAMEADRMVNSFIAKKDLDSEMTVVRNEMESGENSPSGILMERVMSTAFLWHNYGKDTIGARSDVERVPIDRLQAFYREFYRPDNAVLVVAGKFDEPKTLGLVVKYFGPLAKPARAVRQTYTSEPTQDGERTVTLRRTGDVQFVGVAWHIPAGTDADYAAVEMAAEILGDQPAGRLYKALVETKKAASVAMTPFQLKDPGMVYAQAMVRMENSVDEARKALLDTVDEIKARPFTKEELERQRTGWLKNFDLMLNNSQNVALRLSEWQAMGDWRMMFLHRDRIERVTLEQVQKAAEKYFVPSNRTVGVFIPEKNPVRAEIADAPDVAKLVEGYKGRAAVSQGEAFDASPANIDKRTIRGQMKGGIKLSMIEKKTRGGQVVATLNVHFGDENNLKGKSFVASLTGQMLSRGTSKHTRQELKDELDKIKAQAMVAGSATGARVRITTTKENLARAVELTLEMLQDSTFPQQEFEQLKQQVLAGLENSKSQPQAIAITALQRRMNPYPKGDVRYTPTIDEQIEGIKAVTLEDVKDFYKRWYGAPAGELAVIGEFDSEGLQKQVAGLLNEWKSQQNYARIISRFQAAAPKNEAYETPDKANAMWLAGMPLKLRDSDPDYPALVLGNYLLGQGMNSRMFARIRTKEGLSYGVGSQLSASKEDDRGIFMALAICAPENAPKVEASFKDELTQILAKGYTAAEVEAGKKSWAQSRAVSRANDGELVSRLAEHAYDNRTMAFDAELEAKVMALTPESIQAAMKRYLDVEKMSFVRAGDFKKANVTW